MSVQFFSSYCWRNYTHLGYRATLTLMLSTPGATARYRYSKQLCQGQCRDSSGMALKGSLVLQGARRRQEDGQDDGEAQDTDAGEAKGEVEPVPRQARNAKCTQSLLVEESVEEAADVVVANSSHRSLREHHDKAESQPESQGHHAAAGSACLNAFGH